MQRLDAYSQTAGVLVPEGLELRRRVWRSLPDLICHHTRQLFQNPRRKVTFGKQSEHRRQTLQLVVWSLGIQVERQRDGDVLQGVELLWHILPLRAIPKNRSSLFE